MAELGRVGNSWNFNFRGVPTFLQVCGSASRQRENFMESLHSDGSATYLLIIWVAIIIPLTMKSKQKPYPSIVFLSIGWRTLEQRRADARLLVLQSSPRLGCRTPPGPFAVLKQDITVLPLHDL